MNYYKAFQVLFKICCWVIVALMVGVWLHKYSIDDDICSVDYKSFKKSEDIELPEISLCFLNPFIDHELKNIGTTSTTYLQHLSSQYFKDELININHSSVTLNLSHYFQSTQISYRNRTVYSPLDTTIRSSFHGFWYEYFLKCFLIETNILNMEDVNYLTHMFNMSLFLKYFKPTDRSVWAMFHSRNQFLLQNNGKALSVNDKNKKYVNLAFLTTKVEILRRRNKPKRRCMEDWKRWDEVSLSEYIKKIGCIAPYYEGTEKLPLCSTKTEMMKWYNMAVDIKSKRDNLPCQAMPRIDVEYFNEVEGHENLFEISMNYPEEVKVITQAREVDEHTLIGNVGGYIGLFLGNI